MDRPVLRRLNYRELREVLLEEIHDLADDMRYCNTLPEVNKADHERLDAYLQTQKVALLGRFTRRQTST
ncbi:hypothetical protein N7457_006238 [Penicillium paradoxum]|uniref:uncharacterized protein n=1 Tax=Penicillium paradoxum TaxID=176176 RepID=UPI002547D962|nr:uncharacterized protein N7457_006238 [Penicillium paradoxum]KAJ5781078.1 hypothetical protein N7457_006238 [Penicillium paradoxum]